MCFHRNWLITRLNPWTIFTFATLMSFLFSSRVIKKFHISFGFQPGLEIGFFGKGVIGFSLSFMIYSTKKKKQKTKKITKKTKQICKKLCTICICKCDTIYDDIIGVNYFNNLAIQ